MSRESRSLASAGASAGKGRLRRRSGISLIEIFVSRRRVIGTSIDSGSRS